jgi:hypothetical protein
MRLFHTELCTFTPDAEATFNDILLGLLPAPSAFDERSIRVPQTPDAQLSLFVGVITVAAALGAGWLLRRSVTLRADIVAVLCAALVPALYTRYHSVDAHITKA